MAIYGRWGDEITLIKEATVADVLDDWSVRPGDKSKQAKQDRKLAAERVGYGMMWWAQYKDGEKRVLVELAYCKADEGWKEIDEVRETLMGEPRYSEAVRKPVKR